MYNINMKRLNLNTNKPFKYGDVREDGFVFVDFRKTRPLKKDGMYQENWITKDKFETQKQYKINNGNKWKAEHKDRVKQTSKMHAKNNSDQYAAKTAKRRAAQLQRTPKWLTESDLRIIEAKYSLAAMFTRETGIIHHVDHIIPLQGKKVSGLHVFSNLRVIPGEENVKKSNKYQI